MANSVGLPIPTSPDLTLCVHNYKNVVRVIMRLLAGHEKYGLLWLIQIVTNAVRWLMTDKKVGHHTAA